MSEDGDSKTEPGGDGAEPRQDARVVDDAEVLDDAFALYATELAPLVSEFVTVPDGVTTDEAEAWAVQIHQFGYALGAVAGARVATDADDPGFSPDRVEELVDEATDAIGRHGVYDEAAFRG